MSSICMTGRLVGCVDDGIGVSAVDMLRCFLLSSNTIAIIVATLPTPTPIPTPRELDDCSDVEKQV